MNKFYNTKDEIETWLNRQNIKNFTLKEDEIYGFVVNVNKTVDLRNRRLKKIPVKFNKVNGHFYCQGNELTDLSFAPKKVKHSFHCANNNLINLLGSPLNIGTDFCCFSNKLESLKGCPKIINGHFDCYNNKLINLEFCPEEINGDFCCGLNNLTTLMYFPKRIKNNVLLLENENLNNLQNIRDFNILYDYHLKEVEYNKLNSKINENQINEIKISKNKI